VLRPAVKGWGKPKDTTQTDVEDVAPTDQRERIQEQLTGAAENKTTEARSHFGKATQDRAAGISAGQEAAEPTKETSNGVRTDQPEPATKATRTRRSAQGVNAEPAGYEASPTVNLNVPDTSAAQLVNARVAVLAIAFNDPSTSLEDGLDIANDLWNWAQSA